MFPPGGCEHDGLLVPGYDRLEEVQQHAVLALASHLQEGELQGVGDLQTIAFIKIFISLSALSLPLSPRPT